MTPPALNPHNFVSSSFDPRVIAIVGGLGSMGMRLAEEFRRDGYEVRLTGEAPLKEIGPTSSKEWKRALNHYNRSACKGADVVVFSVPIPLLSNGNGLDEIFGKTPPRGWRDKLVIDICSTKTGPVRAMSVLKGATVIGTHPMFGPKVKTLEGQTVFMCPAHPGDHRRVLKARLRVRLAWIKSFWKRRGVNIVETTPEEHDEFMPSVQFSVLLSILLFGEGLRTSGVSLDQVQEHGTPNSRALCSRLARMISPPMLATYTNLAFDNPKNIEWLERARGTVDELKAMMMAGGRERFMGFLSRLAQAQSERFREHFGDLSVFLDECAAKQQFVKSCLAKETDVKAFLAEGLHLGSHHPPRRSGDQFPVTPESTRVTPE